MKQGGEASLSLPSSEIRISHFSPSSERCPPLAVLQTIALFSVRCKLQAWLLPSHPRLNLLCLTCFNGYKKKESPAGEKPEPVRTHLRNMIIVPEMIESIISVYNGKSFNQVAIKPEMIGHYLAEFSISYKPVKHGRPGIGATNSSRFIMELAFRDC